MLYFQLGVNDGQQCPLPTAYARELLLYVVHPWPFQITNSILRLALILSVLLGSASKTCWWFCTILVQGLTCTSANVTVLWKSPGIAQQCPLECPKHFFSQCLFGDISKTSSTVYDDVQEPYFLNMQCAPWLTHYFPCCMSFILLSFSKFHTIISTSQKKSIMCSTHSCQDASVCS